MQMYGDRDNFLIFEAGCTVNTMEIIHVLRLTRQAISSDIKRYQGPERYQGLERQAISRAC